MKETEEMPTIVQRLKQQELLARQGEFYAQGDLEEEAAAEIERLQSALATALERVKVLEAVVKDIAGISLSNPRNVEASLEYAVGKARAVLQSSGGK